MTEHDLKYPVITISQSIVNIKKDIADLTVCSSYAFFRGYFVKMFIVDSLGVGYHVISTHRLDRESKFDKVLAYIWDKTISITLVLKKEYENTPVEKLKSLLYKSFNEEDSWTSGDGFIELETNINKAQTTHEVFEILENWMK